MKYLHFTYRLFENRSKTHFSFLSWKAL